MLGHHAMYPLEEIVERRAKVVGVGPAWVTMHDSEGKNVPGVAITHALDIGLEGVRARAEGVIDVRQRVGIVPDNVEGPWRRPVQRRVLTGLRGRSACQQHM